jgi:pSer/pThr/pTyr-binding forkhead associated (FHA) protein
MAKLIVTLKGKTIKEIQLSRDVPITIGRDETNTLQLENVAVSRYHAKIFKQGWPFFIEDLKSTNGTYHNGNRIRWKVALTNKDKITIGKHTLIFEDKKLDYEDEERLKNLNPEDTLRIPDWEK